MTDSGLCDQRLRGPQTYKSKSGRKKNYKIFNNFISLLVSCHDDQYFKRGCQLIFV